LSPQAPFAEELAHSENSDDCLFSLRGNHAQLDLAALDVADEISSVALRKHDRILVQLGDGLSIADL
jgi:hypothetical protein